MIEFLLVVAAGYLVLCLALFFLQSGMVYRPEPVVESRPKDIGLEYEDLFFSTSDGVLLNGWHVPARGNRSDAMVLFCHGNAGNISHRLETLRIFHSMGLSCLIFDYRGYGLSKGRPSERGTYLDSLAAWDLLTNERGTNPSRIIVWGRSLGGAVASRLAREKNPGALVIESSFTSIPDMGRGMYPFLPVRLLSRFEYDTRRHAAGAGCPVLVVHSPDDEVIPFRAGKEIFGAAGEPKSFLEIKGGHNEGFLISEDNYKGGVSDFLLRHKLLFF